MNPTGNSMLIFLVILLPFLSAAEPTNISIEKINAAEAKLHVSESRMEGLAELISLAGMRMYEGSVFFLSGDKEADELRGQARNATYVCGGFNDVSAALEHSNRDVRLWGIFGFKFGHVERAAWVPLLPKLERIAKGDDADLRRHAVERLMYFPEARTFLDERIESEDFPDVLMALVYQSHVPKTNERFCGLLLKLLNNNDVRTRNRALVFIGSNPRSAPMWQIYFNTQVIDRVLGLTKSEEDRPSAVFALDAISHLDKERCVAALLELAQDKSPSVRWQVPLALKAYLERPEVTDAMNKLVDDADPQVQYFAITATGLDKHLDKLRLLSRSENKVISELSKAQLERFDPKTKTLPKD